MAAPIKFSFKKFTKEFKKSNLFIRGGIILFVLLVIMGLISIVYLVAAIGSLSAQSFYNFLLKPLGYDFSKTYGIFLGFTFIVFVITWLSWGSSLIANRKINWWLVAVVYISGFLVIFGLSIVNQSYPQELPKNFTWSYHDSSSKDLFESGKCQIQHLSCYSITHKSNFVIGDDIICTFSISKSCKYDIEETVINLFYLSNESDQRIPLPQYNSKEGYMRFTIKEGLREVMVTPTFVENQTRKTFLFADISIYNKYTPTEYNSKNRDKSLLLVTLLSVGIFAAISALNNLKQLLQEEDS